MFLLTHSETLTLMVKRVREQSPQLFAISEIFFVMGPLKSEVHRQDV